ncbi:MAG: TIM barrel protein [Desulfobacula sp.]|nr:TIM barrel protein [Desulfobacula sp.]
MKRQFKLGTTSFIVPDHIIPNVEKLGPYLDEIELLVFESTPDDVVPSKADVMHLYHLSQEYNLTYNVHLPTDVSVSSFKKTKQQQACDRLLSVIDRFSPLLPTTHTLHLDMPKRIRNSADSSNDLKNWKANTHRGLEMLLSGLIDPGMISIETLNYSFNHVEPMVKEFNLQVCIDAGHQIKYSHNLLETFTRHKQRTPLIHLHGVDFSTDSIKDHTSLDRSPPMALKDCLTILEKFTGVVSIEVFNLNNLNGSLAQLSKWFDNIPQNIGMR